MGSTLFMIERILEQQTAICAVLMENRSDCCLLLSTTVICFAYTKIHHVKIDPVDGHELSKRAHESFIISVSMSK